MRADTPSATARMVARGLVFVAGEPRWRALVPPETLALTRALLAAVSPGERWLLALLERPLVRQLVAWVEGRVAPGILLHYALRKRLLEEVVETAIRDGFRQVVVLGAGLDTLALRWHRMHSELLFVEVDHPATQRLKRAGSTGAGPNLHFVAADLGEGRLPEILRAVAPFDPDADTLFLAEGVLMYLADRQVGALCDGVRATIQPGAACRFAFTFLELQADDRPDFAHAGAALRWWLRRRGEPFRWGVGRDALPLFLARHGFALRALATPPELRTRYGIEALSRVNGDLVCVADRA